MLVLHDAIVEVGPYACQLHAMNEKEYSGMHTDVWVKMEMK